MTIRVHTFKIDVYPPAILPMLAVYSMLVYSASPFQLSPLQSRSRWRLSAISPPPRRSPDKPSTARNSIAASRVVCSYVSLPLPPPSLPQSLTRPPSERRPRRLLLRPLHRHPPLRLRPEQRRHRAHAMREQDGWPLVLRLPHHLRRAGQDLRRFPCQ